MPADFDGQPINYERQAYLASERDRRRRRRLAERKAQAEANRDVMQRAEALVDLETGLQGRTKADICNVEFINSSDLDEIIDGSIEAVRFQHALEDGECR